MKPSGRCDGNIIIVEADERAQREFFQNHSINVRVSFTFEHILVVKMLRSSRKSSENVYPTG